MSDLQRITDAYFEGVQAGLEEAIRICNDRVDILTLTPNDDMPTALAEVIDNISTIRAQMEQNK